MTIGMQRSTDPALVPQVRAYVVYDRITGEVLHIHRSVTFPGSPAVIEKPQERALRLAGNKSPENAGVIEVDPKDVHHRSSVVVDIVQRRLVRNDV